MLASGHIWTHFLAESALATELDHSKVPFGIPQAQRGAADKSVYANTALRRQGTEIKLQGLYLKFIGH